MSMDVKDIVERETDELDARPPEPPKPVSKQFTKKWAPRRRRVVLDPEAGPAAAAAARPSGALGAANIEATPQPGPGLADQPPLTDAERIHLENVRKIQKMSSEEIEREREEIFRSMDPAVLGGLLRRAQLKEAGAPHAPPATRPRDPPSVGTSKADAPKAGASRPGASTAGASKAGVSKAGTLTEPGVATKGTRAPVSGTLADWDPSPSLAKDPMLAQATPPASTPAVDAGPRADSRADSRADLRADSRAVPPADRVPSREDVMPEGASHGFHFPPPPEELRQYFPDLPVETDKLAWMQPIGDSEEGEYSAELVSVAPSELRFDFKGNLVTPRQSRLISTKAGLHHHGDAPSAAGYTLPELAHLSRSSHPAQRAMAIQTSGRVLHKLRLRKFARSSDVQEGLEALVKTTHILDTLAEAADETTRSLTVRTLATEALWLANTDNRKQTPSAADSGAPLHTVPE